jgi:threonine dehydrogenase-like Zn-dependent dehydrogenase
VATSGLLVLGRGGEVRVEAVTLSGPGARCVEVRVFDVPDDVGDGEVLLGVELAGICGSDVHRFNGWYETRDPVIAGHEVVGVVLAAAGAVDADGVALALGDRVVPESTIPCRRCPSCLAVGSRYGKLVDYAMCPASRLLGSTPLDEPLWLSGGFATVMRLPREAILHRLPESMPARTAVLLEPFAVAMRALWKAEPRPSDVVAVVGPGTIGLLSVVAALESAAATVVLVGTRDERLEVGRSLGATGTINVQREDAEVALVQIADGRKADRVIDASGTRAGFELSLSLLGRGGTYVGLAGLRPDETVAIRPDRLAREKIDILFSHLGAAAYRACLETMRSNRYVLEALITHEFPLSCAEDALRAADERRDGAIKIVLNPAAKDG